MSREVTIPVKTVTEEIASISHAPGENIQFLVGKGTVTDGKFNFIVPQQFESYMIVQSLYQDFISAHPAGFTIDDLWDYVDILRSGADSTRPSPNYDYDGVTQAWVPNIDKAIAAAKAAVEKERIRLSNLPITYNDITIDLDDVAKSNLHGKLAKIAAAESLGQIVKNMVWRDTLNDTHTWATLAAYKGWLDGVVIAASQRNTDLYLAAWVHKAAIDALDNVPAIEAYDIFGGWN